MHAVLMSQPVMPRNLPSETAGIGNTFSMTGLHWYQVKELVVYARWLDAVAIAATNAVGRAPVMSLIDLGTTERPLVGIEIASITRERHYSINVVLTKETVLLGVPGTGELDVALPQPVAVLGFARDLAARLGADIAKSTISV